jgi:arylamine N-acetyltransferase
MNLRFRRLSTVWRDVYRFTQERHIPADYEVAKWITATHPKSHFTSNLLAERVTPESRFSIFNMRVTERRANKHVVKRVLLLDALETGLGIDTPGDPHEIWERIPKND